ncbi:hypothetical protein, variant 2 [Aphanomyces astaci]|uniref:Fanconi-associated nuclease n=1 Tax=Aphanomyces astaci TaxID=112090 RepID=W4GB38_APHAT|nr:hypothetical protein, variant 2 [Aphanomyces astaci]ETV76902.1 hypothetical protein, variant 2 [Aphanomyces astaci]|eukprot:XP_009833814.1 hypothetical protein, variant 2 [Aphanomyces astaci]
MYYSRDPSRDGRHRRVQVEIRRSIQNQDMLERLRAFVTTQRRIDGSFLPLSTHLHAALALTSFDAPDLSSPHRQHRVHDPTSLTLFQIHPRTRDAFYRMHRLMYMTLSLPVQPTLKRATWGDWQRAVCRYEPTAWPGLLVIFGKVAAFPRVTLAAPSRPLFPTLHALMAYECASVLRHATRLIVDGVRLDHLLPSSARGLTADWLDVRPPTLLAFAGAASPSITSSSFSSSQPTKADFCDNVHAFLQSVDNMDSFVGELRACLASSLHLTREDDKQRRVFLEPYDATYALARSMDLVVGVYEKLGEYDKALVLLQELLATSVLGHKRGSWYTRLAINLEMHMKQPTDARAVCDTALSDPRVFPADRMDLLRRHRRLAKTPTTEDKEVVVEGCYPTHTIDGRPLNRAVGEKSRFIGYDDDSVTVEALVLQHYKSQGWHGAHDEGASFRSLLGLLLWDVMFLNDVPDVFQTPFQSRPLDMDMRYSDHFYNARAAAIDAVVMKLRASSALDLCAWIAATWHAHQGTQCWLVRWEGSLTLPYMQLMAIGIGAPALAAIVQVWVKHLETSGLPDLFMLRVVARPREHMGLPAHLVDRHTNCVDIPAWSAMEGGGDIDALMGQHQTVEAQFVEVKGPRDRLSDTQIVWLDRLNAAGISSVVCYVQEPPTKKKKKQKTQEEDEIRGKPTTDPPTCTTSTSKTKRSKGIPPPHVPIELLDY